MQQEGENGHFATLESRSYNFLEFFCQESASLLDPGTGVLNIKCFRLAMRSSGVVDVSAA